MVASRPLAVPISVLLVVLTSASCDLFHNTDWQNLCEADPFSCPLQGGASGQGGEPSSGSGGGATGATGSATGGSGPSSGPGSGGACPSVEDCATPGDDDCDGSANEECDLVLYLAFDEGSGTTAMDSSGNGHHGTHDAPYVPGKKGTALAFDGARMVTVPADAGFTWGAANANFTISYWLRLLAPPPGQWRGLFHKGDSDCGPGDRTSAQFIAPMEQTIHAALSTTYVDPNGNCSQEVLNTPALPEGTWVHFASVKEGDSNRIYLDGVLAVSSTIQPVIANQAPLYLGKDPWYLGMTGELDEVQVYGRALSETEVAELAK